MLELNCNFDGGTYIKDEHKYGYWGYVLFSSNFSINPDDKPLFIESFVENSSSKPKDFLYSHIPGSRFPLNTNNRAEYMGFLSACLRMKKSLYLFRKVDIKLNINGDSKLVINQMNRKWVCREPNLYKMWKVSQDLLYSIQISYKNTDLQLKWVSRTEPNQQIADKVARQLSKDTKKQLGGEKTEL